MVYDKLTDKELFDKISQAALAEKLETHDEWKLLRVAADRIVERAVRALIQTPATNTAAVIELQQVIKKYKFGLFAEIDLLRQEGEFVLDELRNRNETTEFFSPNSEESPTEA